MASRSATNALMVLVPGHASAVWLQRLLLSSQANQLVQHLRLALKLKLKLHEDLGRPQHGIQKGCNRVDNTCARACNIALPHSANLQVRKGFATRT